MAILMSEEEDLFPKDKTGWRGEKEAWSPGSMVLALM